MEITQEQFDQAFELHDKLVNMRMAGTAEHAVLRQCYDAHPARRALEEVSHLFGISMRANFAYMETVGEDREKWRKLGRRYAEHPCYVWYEMAMQRAAERLAERDRLS